MGSGRIFLSDVTHLKKKKIAHYIQYSSLIFVQGYGLCEVWNDRDKSDQDLDEYAYNANKNWNSDGLN